MSTSSERRNYRVIWLLLAASFVVILNETIMNVALRELMIDLRIDARAAQWLTSAFMLTMAIVIPITGILIQRFNTRSLFITAMSLFSSGTLIAALAPGFEVLLGARIVQASGTAIMLPLLMTSVMTLIPVDKRGRMMGNMSIVIAVAPALGPTVAGLILNVLNWRWMFWVVLPFALVMLVIGARRVENVGEQSRVPIDVASVILAAFGFGGLVYGLSRIGDTGGTGEADAASALPMWIALGVGVLALAAFIARQLLLQRRDQPLLDLRTFRSPLFSLALALMVVGMLAMLGTLIILPIYVQQVLHLEPLETGLLVMPGGLVMGLLGPIVGRLYDRYGPRVLVVPGTMVVSAGLWVLATVTETTPPVFLLVVHVGLSAGLALMFTPLFTAGLGAVPPHLYSHGSAVVSTLQQVAGAAGAALFVTVMAAQSAVLAADGVAVDAAAAGGVRAAFLLGAVVSLGAVVGSFFMRKPAEAPASAVEELHPPHAADRT